MRDFLKPRAKSIAALALVGVPLIGGLLFLAAQQGETQGGKKAGEAMRLAKVTVRWTQDVNYKKSESLPDGVATGTSRERFDATIVMEVPAFGYWEAKNIKWFKLGLEEDGLELRSETVDGVETVEPIRGRLVSFTLAGSYFDEGRSEGYSRCRHHGRVVITTWTTQGGGTSQPQPGPPAYPWFEITFKDGKLASVSARGLEYTFTSQGTISPDPEAECKGEKTFQHSETSTHPGEVAYLDLGGWSVQESRTRTSYHVTGRYSKHSTESPFGPQGLEDTTVARTLSFAFDLEPQELEADPGGPYRAVRGEQLQLDGSRSKGKNLTYAWTFDPISQDCDGHRGNNEARKDGVRPTVVLLCSTKVTLKVSDGKKSDQRTVSADVNAREEGWKTNVVKPQIDAYLTTSRLCLPEPHFGRSVCALDGESAFAGAQASGHIFHKTPDQITWEGIGYELQSVHDPKGPFDKWWYVAKNHLKIHRAALINTDLNKSSELYKENMKRGYRDDIDTLSAAVTAHERMHGTLIEEALPKNDPAKKMEKMVHPNDNEALKLKIDLKIQEAENALWDATKDDNVKERLKKLGFNRPGKVLLPLCNTDPPRYQVFSIPSFATLGD